MKRMIFVRQPVSNPLGMRLPVPGDGGQGYYPIAGNAYMTRDDFLGTAIDTDDWTPSDTSLGTGAGAQPTVASNYLSMVVPTSTAGTTSIRVRSAMSASAHIYNIPFRVSWDVRFSTTAGAGVAPTGGLDAYLGIRDTGDTHIAQFHFDLSTAGSSSLASPVINLETRQGSTAAAFINSAAVNIWNSAQTRTATVPHSFMIEVTHQGVAFGTRDTNGVHAFRLHQYWGNKVPRQDLNYYIDMRMVANGTAGYTQTAGVSLEVDTITVEQLGPNFQPMLAGMGAVAVEATKTFFGTQLLPSASGSLVTSGQGVFLGASVASTATTGVDLFLAAWDCSAASSSIYDFSNNASSAARLIWYQQVNALNSAGADISAGTPAVMFDKGIPFYRGLIVGSATVAGTAVGNSALNALVVYKAS